MNDKNGDHLFPSDVTKYGFQIWLPSETENDNDDDNDDDDDK